MLTYSLMAGVLLGLYFGLVGLGLNLIFGVMRIVNLAHGSFLMLGAFLTYWLFNAFGLSPYYSMAAAFVSFTLLGVPLYYLVVPRLLCARDPEMLSLILFFGMSQCIEAVAGIIFGMGERSIPAKALGAGPVVLLGQSFPAAWVISALVSAAAVGSVYVYLYQTRLGYITRAIMVHRQEAEASGIDVHRTSAIAFGVSLGLSAVGGVLAPFMFGTVSPAMGHEINLTSFAVIVVGSLGNPLGTVLGGLVYGIGLMLMQTYFSSWANLLPDLVLIGILLARPTGLLGKSVRHA